MRTKTLLLTAALAAAGAVSAMAQANVYSVNYVGYANISVGNGYTMVTQPFKGGPRTVGDLIVNAPSQLNVYKILDGGGSQSDSWDPADGFWGNSGDNTTSMTIDEGAGIVIFNAGAAFTITFVGEGAQGTGANAVQNAIPAGVVVRASKIPQGGLLTTDLGLHPAHDLTIVQLIAGGGSANLNYDFGIGGGTADGWIDGEPNIRLGESFFVISQGESWSREFSVN